MPPMMQQHEQQELVVGEHMLSAGVASSAAGEFGDASGAGSIAAYCAEGRINGEHQDVNIFEV